MIVFASVSCAVLALSVIAVTHNYVSNRAFADYEDRNPYTRSLTINASYFQNGSGTLTVEGNQFAYSGVTIEGNNVSFAQDGYFRSVVDSGASSGSDLSGAGYTTLNAHMSGAFNGNVTLNGQSQALNLASDSTHSFAINKNGINLVFNASGFKVSEFVVSYKCLANDINIDGAANETIWSSEVMSNPLTVKANDSYKTEVYSRKTLEGIYVYAEQHVAVRKNQGDGWWQKDNLELRFRSGTEFSNHGLADDTQIWVCADGRKSNDVTSFATTDYVLNNSTNLYDKTYELFISWETSGLSYNDKIICLFGSNYEAGFIWNTDGSYWSQDNWKYVTVTSSGLKSFSFDPDVEYQELLASPVTNSGDNWNSLVTQTHMNGNKSWAVKAELHSRRLNLNSDWFRDGWVSEVFSPSWSNGGWTFEMDWWGWGSWNKTTNDSGSGVEGNCGNGNYSEVSTASDWDSEIKPALLDATDEMDVEVIYRFDANTGKIGVIARLTSTFEGHVGQHVYLSFTSCPISYRGEMIIGNGRQNAEVTISSIKLFEGSTI